MKKYNIILLVLLLCGCGALNYRTSPKIMDDCGYTTLEGTEFKFNKLPVNQQPLGYRNIYVAQSKESATLPYASYYVLKGKLTEQFYVRNYPKSSFWGHGRRGIAFGDHGGSLLYDDGYDDIYLSEAQREERDRKAKFVFRQAVLEDCQIIYIALDSLAKNREDPKLIAVADLSIIK